MKELLLNPGTVIAADAIGTMLDSLAARCSGIIFPEAWSRYEKNHVYNEEADPGRRRVARHRPPGRIGDTA